MTTVTQESAAIVDRAIDRVAAEFKEAPARVLTEDDIKCYLFSKLIPAFGSIKPTRDGVILGAALHSELSWFDENAKLHLRPDISIVDPQNLSILHGIEEGVQLPSKGAHFKGSAILVELKFWHERTRLSDSKLSEIKYDISKIEDIAARNNSSGGRVRIFGRIVLFSRYPHLSRGCDELMATYSEGDLRMRVVTSGIFPRPSAGESFRG